MPDADIPKATKKMILFASPANKILQWLMDDPEPSQNAIASKIKVAPGTISNWKSGGLVSKESYTAVFSAVRKSIEAKAGDKGHEFMAALNRFITSFHDEKIDMYATAKSLGMEIDDSQKILDEVFYKRYPVFPRMYYASAKDADETISQYRGLYKVYVQRNSFWMLCPLRVRYTIDVTGGPLIRCKMNLPIIDGYEGIPYWEYDGFVTRKPHKLFWMFEKRQKYRNDHFYFITDTSTPFRGLVDDGKDVRTMYGRYLTTGQDEFQSIVSHALIMQKHSVDGDSAESFMHSPTTITDKVSISALEKLVEEFHTSPRRR